MSEELVGVIIGGAIGLFGALVGALVNHWLEIRRDERRLKIEEARELRRRLTEGISTHYREVIDVEKYELVNQSMNKLSRLMKVLEEEFLALQRATEERKAISETGKQAKLPQTAEKNTEN